MPKESLIVQIDAIINEASIKAEELIKAAVRHRMSKKPYPKSFVFAMGSNLWKTVSKVICICYG